MDRRVPLGRSPLSVAPLGVGCWAWGDNELWGYGRDHSPADVVDAFRACLDAGLDFFDTAESYGWGKSEQIVGSLSTRAGRPLTVATKYAPLAGRGGARAIPRAIAGSLRRLKRPQIDLYQLHWPDSDEIPIAAAMAAFADALEAGQLRAVGVSNFSAAEMRAAHAALARRGIPLATNQVRYSLLHRAPETDGVLAACRDLGVTLLAYSPLEQGVLTGKYGPDRLPPPERASRPSFAPARLAAAEPLLARLRTIAADHGVEPAAAALAWLLAKPDVVPLAGAKTGKQARSNAQALAVVLTPEQLAALDAAAAAASI